jgi:hypothetical protein
MACTNDKRDDSGFAVLLPDGRIACHITSREETFVYEVNGKKLAAPERVIKPYPRDKWRAHFSGEKLTVAEVQAVADFLANCPEDDGK